MSRRNRDRNAEPVKTQPVVHPKLRQWADKGFHYPNRQEMSFFQVAKLMTECVAVLNKLGIKGITFKKVCVKKNRLQLQIKYSKELHVLPAERIHRGINEQGKRYECYALTFGDNADLVWERVAL